MEPVGADRAPNERRELAGGCWNPVVRRPIHHKVIPADVLRHPNALVQVYRLKPAAQPHEYNL